MDMSRKRSSCDAEGTHVLQAIGNLSITKVLYKDMTKDEDFERIPRQESILTKRFETMENNM